jgi:hypothetical protein
MLNSDKYNEYQQGNSDSKNGMEVNWKDEGSYVNFEMSAPTNGWVTIGFNTSNGMTGCYLLMGRIKKGKVEVVEHYTQSLGNCAPISSYDIKPQVIDQKGKQEYELTSRSFSIPQKAISNY